MLATPGALPRAPGWVFEVKWDGMRVLARLGNGRVRLTSRNGNDATATFPEFAALAALEHDAVLDGEVVCFDDHGRPCFARLAERIGVTDPRRARRLAASAPATYAVFDLLALDGEDTTGRPFAERRGLLTGLTLPSGPFVVPDTFADGEALWLSTEEQGLEGVIAKRLDAPYLPGVRSGAWIKRSHRSATDAIVVGWRPASGPGVASLVVASVAANGALLYRGTAGSGISAAMGRQLHRALRAAPSPVPVVGLAEHAHRLAEAGFVWAQPGVVVEVRHLGSTAAGRFRQPVVARLRPDLAAAEIGAVPAGEQDGAGEQVFPAGGDAEPVTAAVGGRTLRLSHLDKVLYPATGTTKARVLEYFSAVAPMLLHLAAGRPITRRRWPDGVAAPSFFEKNLPAWAPEWIGRATLPAGKGPITFPVLQPEDTAALIWLAAHSALELHTPQWRIGGDGRPQPPDRLVIDLDPGPGAGLHECGVVALVVRRLLAIQGLQSHAVLSGSKGLHVYAALPSAERGADEVTAEVRQIGARAAAELPDLVVLTMAKQVRVGKVFLDWSQNRAAKTTLAPWSLRGTDRPYAALPVSWDEVAGGQLQQVMLDEALERLRGATVPAPW